MTEITKQTTQADAALVGQDAVTSPVAPNGTAPEAPATGPVTLLCRPMCSFRPLSVRRRRGFSSLMLSVACADCRSR
jgi:hypothetical protein